MSLVLRPYQSGAVDNVRALVRAGRNRVLLVAPTGAGKCLGLGTPVLRYDGRVVPVEGVQEGDLLMSYDSTPRRVLSTARGEGPLFRIVPVKGDPWVCNDVHVLTLVHTETHAIVDIPLNEYLAKSKSWRHCHKLAAPSSGVDFPSRQACEIDPYFMGVWFGDGTKRDGLVAVSNPDPEVFALVQATAEAWGLRVRTEMSGTCPTHVIVGERGQGNPLLQALRRVVPDPTTISGELRTASRADRQAFLAGIIDTDGYVTNGGVEIVQKHAGIADGVMFIARSLGLRATSSQKVVNGTSYERIHLSGDFSSLPIRIERKRPAVRQQKKLATRTGFAVEPIGVGPYAGFELDGDGRFLLGDFTVTHNTVVATHIIECSVALGNRVLFLAHRRELITQAFKKLIGCSCRPGFDHDSMLPDPECRGDGMPRRMVGVLMANDRRRNPGAVVQVASIDTLRNRALPAADLVIVDEAHRALAKTYRDITAGYPDAAVIGLTATPYRADRRGLGEAFGDMVVVASPRELIADGFLVQPRVFTVPAASLPDLSSVRIKGNDYDPEQLSAAVDRRELVGDIVAHWQAKASDRLTVVFAASVEHSRHIVERFRAAGVPAEHLDGMTDTAERDAILARLERGETRVVSNMGVLVEGWDQPSCKCVILARPTKSTGAYLQMAGRILRPWRGVGAVILDHAGCVLEHGLPQSDREFSLDAAPKRKKSTAPPCKTCLSCFAIIAASLSVCPECGHGFVTEPRTAPAERDGELVEVREPTIEEKRAKWTELCAQAVERRYAPGWAKHQYKKQFGVWPPTTFAFPDRPKPHASDAVKRAHLEALREECVARGYRVAWVEHRYRAKWGEDVPAGWLAPQLRPAPPPPPAPAPAPLEEWSL